jgi:hypothetical protein
VVTLAAPNGISCIVFLAGLPAKSPVRNPDRETKLNDVGKDSTALCAPLE